MSLAQKYQSVLRERFPNVVVNAKPVNVGEALVPIYDVYCVPDKQLREFVEFLMAELPEIARTRQLPEADLIPHSVTATRSHYPHVGAAAARTQLRRRTSKKLVKPVPSDARTRARTFRNGHA